MSNFDPTCTLCADWNSHRETTACPRCGVGQPERANQLLQEVAWRGVAEREHSVQKAAMMLGFAYDEALEVYESWLAHRSKRAG